MKKESRKEFTTDGELYDESLTRKTKDEAFSLLRQIINQININGFIAILDVVCVISKLPMPNNWQYACTHGWTRKSVTRFLVRKTGDGRYAVHLGAPHTLLNDE